MNEQFNEKFNLVVLDDHCRSRQVSVGLFSFPASILVGFLNPAFNPAETFLDPIGSGSDPIGSLRGFFCGSTRGSIGESPLMSQGKSLPGGAGLSYIVRGNR